MTQIEDKQNEEYYRAQRQIHNAIMGHTPVKTVQNRQYIDNISAYDNDLQRISESVCHKLDLGQNSLPGAQQYNTVQAAAVTKPQDKITKVQDKENTSKAYMIDDNGQNNREIYRMAEYIIPQLDGTHNTSNTSDIDSHDYLDLANIESTQPKTRGQKKRQKAAEAELANTYLAEVQSSMPNTRGRKLRQKVPNNEIVDIDKIVKNDMPRYTIRQDLKVTLHSRKSDTETDKKLKENRKLQAEKANYK